MNRRIGLLLALMALPFVSQAQTLGASTEIPPARGVERLFGSCAALPGQDPCNYDLVVWKDTRTGHPVILVAGKSQNNGNPPDFLETDRIALPRLAKGYDYSTVCRAVGDHFENTTLFAAVRFRGDENISKDVSHAWRLNTKTGKFSAVPTDNIRCDYEGP